MSDDCLDLIVQGTVTDVFPRRENADVVNFSVCTEVRGKKFWTRCAAWGNLATQTEEMSSGTRVKVVGYPKANTFKNKNGEIRTTVECVAKDVQILGAEKVNKLATKRGGKASKIQNNDEDFDF